MLTLSKQACCQKQWLMIHCFLMLLWVLATGTRDPPWLEVCSAGLVCLLLSLNQMWACEWFCTLETCYSCHTHLVCINLAVSQTGGFREVAQASMPVRYASYWGLGECHSDALLILATCAIWFWLHVPWLLPTPPHVKPQALNYRRCQGMVAYQTDSHFSKTGHWSKGLKDFFFFMKPKNNTWFSFDQPHISRANMNQCIFKVLGSSCETLLLL